jgi:signal transduction histidine kinase
MSTFIRGDRSVTLKQKAQYPLDKLSGAIQAVPVRVKIAGIVMLPVFVLGLSLNYWIKTGLSDWLSYLLSDQRVQVAMSAGSRSVILVTFLAALFSMILGFFLTYILTRPLLDLHKVVLAVTAGDLDARAPVWAKDEIGDVASSVNEMINRLTASQTQLTAANKRLEALNRVAMAAGKELELREVLNAILKGTLEILDLDKGWVYLRENDQTRYYLAHQIGLSEPLQGCLYPGREDELCPCQRDLEAGKMDPYGTARFDCPRIQDAFPDMKHTEHLTIPLQAKGQTFGMINLLCDRDIQPSQESMELISAIGAQASEIVANAWLHARLVEKEEARRALLESLVRTQEDERGRLARELHDEAGQTLTNLVVRLKTLEQKIISEDIRAELNKLQGIVEVSIDQVRELSYRLRPALLEDFGLARAIQNLAEEMFKDTGIKIRCRFDLQTGGLPRDVEIAMYRITQESLTNIIHHAQAQHVDVELTQTPLGICLRVEDDGAGFDPDRMPVRKGKPHLGLIGMQERAEMLGGSLNIFTSLQTGTSVEVRVPIIPEENTA